MNQLASLHKVTTNYYTEREGWQVSNVWLSSDIHTVRTHLHSKVVSPVIYAQTYQHDAFNPFIGEVDNICSIFVLYSIALTCATKYVQQWL